MKRTLIALVALVAVTGCAGGTVTHGQQPRSFCDDHGNRVYYKAYAVAVSPNDDSCGR